MPTESGVGDNNIDATLEAAIRNIDGRIRVSEQNKEARKQYEEKRNKLQQDYQYLGIFLEDFKPLVEDIEKYLGKKKKESMHNINNAIRLATEIIPDADEGMMFEVDGDEAWLSTSDGLEVSRTEGDGFQQVSSAFLRGVLIESNPGILDTMIADEIFSQVSQENSARLSLYLNIMLQNMQIISIEQKPQVYSNVDYRMYKFVKEGKYTMITHEDVKRSEIDAGEVKGVV